MFTALNQLPEVGLVGKFKIDVAHLEANPRTRLKRWYPMVEYHSDSSIVTYFASFPHPTLERAIDSIRLRLTQFDAAVDALETADGQFPTVPSALDDLRRQYGTDRETSDARTS